MKKQKSKKLKPTPHFKSEAKEREFWETHDSTEYVDWSRAQWVKEGFPNLKPSTKAITVRLPTSMINDLKVLANRKDVAYQALLKVYLSERIEQEKLKKVG